MRRLFSLCTTVCLFSWLLPLGAFIKPSQEKTACDGQRPFHMCSMPAGKAMPDRGFSSKIGFSDASDVNARAKSSASAGNDFSSPASLIDDLKLCGLLYASVRSGSYALVLSPLEHVPKFQSS